mmetsp:Transcript_53852/g.125609  ORF Transcript_53852/g.125609 Transcript_53852/m.125609 type:complete len:216 (-) Transcript_53852:1241-1888(-)
MEVDGSQPAGKDAGKRHGCGPALLKKNQETVPHHLLLGEVGAAPWGKRTMLELFESIQVTPRPEHVEVDDDLRHHVPNGRDAIDEVCLNKLRKQGQEPPQKYKASPARAHFQQHKEGRGQHIHDLADSQRVALGLCPATPQCGTIRVFLGSVIQNGEEDGHAPRPALSLQEALGKHVPILGQVLRVPAPYGTGQGKADRVTGIGNVAVPRIRKAG